MKSWAPITELVSRDQRLLVRRLTLLPGQATPWHRDACRRLSVVVRGDRLTIEFRDGTDPIAVELAPGLAGWDDPEPRVHRAVNTGSTTFEEVTTFLLAPDLQDPQPIA